MDKYPIDGNGTYEQKAATCFVAACLLSDPVRIQT